MSSNAALQQCGDIILLQEQACKILQGKLEAARRHVSQEDLQSLQQELQSERARCRRMCSDLERERERARSAESELASLRRRLSREKATFEDERGLLKSQALSDSSKAEDLLAKCSALEALCAGKDEELAARQRESEELRAQLQAVEERHRREVLELKLSAQQDTYLASLLHQEARKKGRGGNGKSDTSSPRA